MIFSDISEIEIFLNSRVPHRMPLGTIKFPQWGLIPRECRTVLYYIFLKIEICPPGARYMS